MVRLNVFRPFITYLLVASFLVPNVGRTQTSPAPSNKFLDALIEAGNENIKPPQVSTEKANLFGLISQTLRTQAQPKGINLATAAIPMPSKYISDFKSEDIKIENGELILISKSTGAEHVFSGIQASQFILGNSYLFVMGSDGKVSAISKDMIKTMGFNSPIPVFEIGRFDTSTPVRLDIMRNKDSYSSVAESVVASHKEEGTSKPAIFAGDLIAVDNQGKLQGVLDLNYIAQKISLDSIVLGLLVTTQNPDFFKDESWLQDKLKENARHLERIQAILSAPNVVAAMEAKDYLDSLSRLSKENVRASIAKLEEVRSSLEVGPQREQFLLTLSVLKEQLGKISEAEDKVQNGLPDLIEVQKINDSNQKNEAGLIRAFSDKIKNSVSSSTMKKLSLSLLVAAGLVAADTLTGSNASNWVLHFVIENWQNLIPDVLKSSTWRWPTIRTTLILSSVVPIVYSIGKIASRFTSWDAKKTIMIASLRTYGALQGSFYLLTRMLNQINFFPAVRAGVNPFASPRMFNAPWASRTQIARNRVKVSEQMTVDKRASALAWLVAHQEILQKQDLNPLALLAAEIEIAKHTDKTQVTLSQKEWAELAYEIRAIIQELTPEGLADIKPEVMKEMLLRAQSLKNNLKQRNRVLSLAKILSHQTKEFWARAIPTGLGNLGYESYTKLMSAVPSDAVSRHAIRQYSINYLFGVTFASFFGARADLSKPENLVSNTHGKTPAPSPDLKNANTILGINPSHLTDATNENARWNTVRRASLWLNYDSKPVLENYTPSESSFPTTQRTASFFETARELTKSAINIKEANYGYYFFRNLQSTVETALAGTLIGVALRLSLLGQPLGTALPAQIWSMGVSIWMYGWFGIAVNRMVIGHDQKIKINSAELRDVQVRIKQGLESQNYEQVASSYNKLIEIYKNTGNGDAVPNHSNVTTEEVQELLGKSIQDPPMPTKPNEKFMTLVTLAGAITIAYLAEAYSVTAFGHYTDWTARMIHGWSMSLMLFFGIHYAQKGINSVWSKVEEKLEARKPKVIEKRILVPGTFSCKSLFAS